MANTRFQELIRKNAEREISKKKAIDFIDSFEKNKEFHIRNFTYKTLGILFSLASEDNNAADVLIEKLLENPLHVLFDYLKGYKEPEGQGPLHAFARKNPKKFEEMLEVLSKSQFTLFHLTAQQAISKVTKEDDSLQSIRKVVNATIAEPLKIRWYLYHLNKITNKEILEIIVEDAFLLCHSVKHANEFLAMNDIQKQIIIDHAKPETMANFAKKYPVIAAKIFSETQLKSAHMEESLQNELSDIKGVLKNLAPAHPKIAAIVQKNDKATRLFLKAAEAYQHPYHFFKSINKNHLHYIKIEVLDKLLHLEDTDHSQKIKSLKEFIENAETQFSLAWKLAGVSRDIYNAKGRRIRSIRLPHHVAEIYDIINSDSNTAAKIQNIAMVAADALNHSKRSRDPKTTEFYERILESCINRKELKL